MHLQSDARWEHVFTLLSGNKLKSAGGFSLLFSHERKRNTRRFWEGAAKEDLTEINEHPLDHSGSV